MEPQKRRSSDVDFVLTCAGFGLLVGTAIAIYRSVALRTFDHFFTRPLIGFCLGIIASTAHVVLLSIIDRLSGGKYRSRPVYQSLQFTLILCLFLLLVEVVFFKSRLQELSHQYWILATTILTGAISLLIFLYFRLLEMVRAQLRLLEKYHIQVIMALVSVLESRDPSKKNHSIRVAEGCELMAKKLGVPPATQEKLKRAALMHDLGMLFIDEHLVQKDTALSPEELSQIRLHPFIVQRILAPLDILTWETQIIKSAQFFIYMVNIEEECNQKAEEPQVKTYLEYSLPGKKLEDIVPEARILSTIDFYDTLTHSRPYRAAISPGDTIRIMRNEIGKRFDGRMVDLLAEMLESREWPREGSDNERQLTPEEEQISKDIQSTAKNITLLKTFYQLMGSGLYRGRRSLFLCLVTGLFLGLIMGLIIYATSSNPVWVGIFVLQGFVVGSTSWILGYPLEWKLARMGPQSWQAGPIGAFLAHFFPGCLSGSFCLLVIMNPALHKSGSLDIFDALFMVCTAALSGTVAAFYRYIQNISNALLADQDKLQKVFFDLICSLSFALEAVDPYTKGHSEKVSIYAQKLGENLGLSTDELEHLKMAALLHDIGKMGISKEIINKPSKLSDEEYAIIKTHPAIGAKALEPVKSLSEFAHLVRAHHESFDGQGYPEKKRMNEIPLFARIISIADSYDAMISNRAYRKGLSHEAAIEELKRCAGTQFDPSLVELFINSFDQKNDRLGVL
jgi:putative nucleotidyltransferase with HDIG domain